MPKNRRPSKKASSWWKRSIDRIVFLFLFGIFFLGYPGQNPYMIAAAETAAPRLRELPITVPEPAPYPENTTQVFPGPEVTATGVVVMDVPSRVVMYKRAEELRLAPASTTKLLTALVALDHWHLDDVITVQYPETEGQVMGLFLGEEITVENLLYGLLIHSGNDAAFALADAYPGGREAFVENMNNKAGELNLTQSTFSNPAGFDDPNHMMTARDLTWLAYAAISNRTIAKMVSIPNITISDVTHSDYHYLTNVNELLGTIPGVGGIKTGWTEEAGENLVSLMTRGGRSVIIVVLHSEDRFGDTAQLIDWIFANHTWRDFAAEFGSAE